MRKGISQTVFWGYATVSSLGVGYATNEFIDAKLVQPRIETLDRQITDISACMGAIAATGAESGIVMPKLPDEQCEPFAEDWADTEKTIGGEDKIKGYVVPAPAEFQQVLDDLESDRASAEKAGLPLAALAGGLMLFMAYGLKRNFEEFN